MLLVLPLVIVVIFSFGVRAKKAAAMRPRSSSTTSTRPSAEPQPFIDSLWMAAAGTLGCLLVGIPLAYSSRPVAAIEELLILLMVADPVLDQLLIRTYAWLIILGPGDGHRGLHR